MKLHRKAFTLVEALVVLVIVSILAAILFVFIPKDASNSGVDSDIYAIRRGVYVTVLEHGTFGSDIAEFAGWLNENLDNELAFSPVDEELLSASTDPWGTRYRILIQGKAAQISSAGENRRFDDDDDHAVLIYYRTIEGRLEVFVKEDNSLSLIDAGGTGAGLFDINNDLLASWTTLVNDYGMQTEGFDDADCTLKQIMESDPSLASGVKLVVADGITELGDYAFAGTSLSEVILPEGLTTIGVGAFSMSQNLTHIYLPDSLSEISKKALYGCISLPEIVIPEDVTAIGDSAFENCTSLALIDLPGKLTSVGNKAFRNCTSASELLFNTKLRSIGEEAFANCTALTEADLPDRIESIGKDCFAGCSQLAEIRLQFVGKTKATSLTATNENKFGFLFGGNEEVPSSLKTVYIEAGNIADSAFEGCTDIESVTLSENVAMVGAKAFEGCDSLRGFYAGAGLTFIGSYAFNACSAMTEAVFTNNVTNIGEYAFRSSGITGIMIPTGISVIKEGTFYQCSSLASITIPYYVEKIEDYAFYGCTQISSVEIPNSVTNMGAGVFGACTGMTSISIPFVGETAGGATNTHFSHIFNCYGTYLLPNLTDVTITGEYDIPDNAFYNCTDLETVKMTGSIKAIGDHAFEDCHQLVNLQIGSLVESIGDYAFASCGKLESVVVPTSVKKIGFAAFESANKLKTMDLPFIGGNAEPLGDNSRLFGYIFGSESGVQINQAYYDETAGHNVLVWFGMPTDLQTVIVRGAIGKEAMGIYGGNARVTVILEDGAKVAPYAFRTDSNSMVKEIRWNDATRVYEYAFANAMVATISVAEGITEIPEGLFSSSNADGFPIRSNLRTVNLPSTLTKIGEKAFKNCTVLTSITLPDGLVSIREEAFAGCSALTAITIPASVTFIGKDAFADCSALTSAVFKTQHGWFYCDSVAATSGTAIAQSSLVNTGTAATYLRSSFVGYHWKRQS